MLTNTLDYDWNQHREEILPIIEELRAQGSTTYKAAILQRPEVKHSSVWRDFLKATYNPSITYNQSGDKMSGENDLNNLVLCRSIRAGIAASTLNRQYGSSFVPVGAKIMKSKQLHPSKVQYPAFLQVKYDGHYTVIIVGVDKDVRLFTSGGHEYYLPEGHQQHDLLRSLQPNVYFAERITTGLLGARRGVALEGRKPTQQCKMNNSFMIFEHVSYEEFMAGESTRTLATRMTELENILKGDKYEFMVSAQLVSDSETALAFTKTLVNEGFEGIMLKQPNVLWRDSKSRRNDYVKFKMRKTADLLCVEELEGQSASTADVIGSLLLRNANGVEVKVSSGLDDAARERWGTYEGKVVEIQYEQKLEDGTYLQPVFLHLREDKQTSDID